MFKNPGMMRRKLMDWYLAERRELPWRRTKDPYKIWISEIVLQQTRVDQGIAYYERLVNLFPDVYSLAAATEESVLKAWQGLGYYSRARNLHHAAKDIVQRFGGLFPEEFTDIITLKGIGDYTAAAIASIAFDQPRPVLDGNVMRVVSRLLALQELADKPPGKNRIMDFLHTHIDSADPGTFNQAVMELGAMVCTPRQPLCSECPLRSLCQARKLGIEMELPVKSPKALSVVRYYYYFVILEKDKEYIYIKKRTANGIWKNMYDFPLLESEKAMGQKTVLREALNRELPGLTHYRLIRYGAPLVHKLTHRELRIRFIEAEISSPLKKQTGLKRIRISELPKFPFPVVVQHYLNQLTDR